MEQQWLNRKLPNKMDQYQTFDRNENYKVKVGKYDGREYALRT